MAVIDGNVMAINPGEEAKMQMFIWNNVFFSLGFDVRDHYKELGGDAAAFVAPVCIIKIICQLYSSIRVFQFFYVYKYYFSEMIYKGFGSIAQLIYLDYIH